MGGQKSKKPEPGGHAVAALLDPVRTFLEKPNVAVLVTLAPSGMPQATPVWFLAEGDRILVNTLRGRAKLRNVARDPRVALAVVDRENALRYVQIRGRVIDVDFARGARDIDRLAMRYLGRPYRYPPSQRPEDRVTLLIEPERVIYSLP